MLNITSIENQLPFRGHFALSNVKELSSEALDHLYDDEKKELEGFKNLRRQQEYVTSRLMLKEMAEKLGATDFKILKDERGCPYGQANDEQYFVSIAHTTEQVFCGISENTAIGVDLEPVGRKVSDRLKPRILHPDESAYLYKMPPIQLWTIKESYIKLRGQGLRMNMNQVQVRHQEREFFVEINNDKSAKICSFQKQDHWLAIAFYCNINR